jgi:hypothetical protein
MRAELDHLGGQLDRIGGLVQHDVQYDQVGLLPAYQFARGVRGIGHADALEILPAAEPFLQVLAYQPVIVHYHHSGHTNNPHRPPAAHPAGAGRVYSVSVTGGG